MDKKNNSESLKIILSTVKDCMTKKNISERQIEKEMDITLGSIYSWRIGKAKPSFDVLIKLANYLNVSVDYLLGRAELQQNNTNNATTSPLLARISKLDKLQQDKVMAYIDGLQGVNTSIATAFMHGQEIGKQQNTEEATMQQQKKFN